MKSFRLNKQLEQDLKNQADLEDKSESEIVREALVEYMVAKKTKKSSYDLGKAFFGEVGSNDSKLSETYKSQLKAKIGAKTTR